MSITTADKHIALGLAILRLERESNVALGRTFPDTIKAIKDVVAGLSEIVGDRNSESFKIQDDLEAAIVTGIMIVLLNEKKIEMMRAFLELKTGNIL
jgi:hypothetical protein